MKRYRLFFLASCFMMFFASANLSSFAQQPTYMINRVTPQFSFPYFFGAWQYQYGNQTIKNKDVLNILQKDVPFAAADFKKANEKFTVGRIVFIGGGVLFVTGLIGGIAAKDARLAGVLTCFGVIAMVGVSVPLFKFGENERKSAIHYYNKYIATTDVNSLQINVSMSNISINYKF